MSSSVPGTNVPPVSFPGIASGIDYNAIITKLTSLTLSQNVSLNAQIATLNNANTELIKINNLLNCVQGTLGALSDPLLFNTWSATSSNTTEGNATVTSGASPVAGTYTITAQTPATATSIQSNLAVQHSIHDGNSDSAGPLSQSYAAVTPQNGPNGYGTITINGVQVTYNVGAQSLQNILANITSQVQAGTGDGSFQATLNTATGKVQIVSANHPLTIGSPSDTGNLLQVLKLSTAPIINNPTNGLVQSTSDIGGINQAAAFNSANQAGYGTAVTSGFFTINGVQISVSASGDNTASVLARINASNAGVVASYDATTNEITLTSKTTGAASIVVGAAGDTSNFLTAAGLTTASGGKTTVGTQGSVTISDPTGASKTVYSNSNNVTNAINGVTLTIGAFTTPYTISIASDSSKLVSAINTFVSAYNGAITEINNATIPPAVVSPSPGSSTSLQSASVGGGVLWNSEIQNVKDQLTSLVTGFFGNSGSSGYNSLASIGLQLTNSFTVLSTAANGLQNSTSNSQPVQTQQLQGTDGTFQPLDVAKFQAALAANASQVQNIFQGSTGISNQLGNYLGLVTGLPTLLNNGIVGALPLGGTAIIQGFENTNNDQISTLTDQIKRITDSANSQADLLRQEFTATEGQLAQYQALQGQLAGFFKGNGG